jgi:hypothetical protein
MNRLRDRKILRVFFQEDTRRSSAAFRRGPDKLRQAEDLTPEQKKKEHGADGSMLL